MKITRKVFTLILASLLLGLAACFGGSQTAQAPPADATPTVSTPDSTPYEPAQSDAETVRVGIILGDENENHLEAVEAEINRLLVENGSAAQLEFVVIRAGSGGNDAYNYHTIEMRKENNDKFDIMPSYAREENYAELAEGGFVLDLTDYLVQYPDLVNMNDERTWREAALDGRNYWIPLVGNPLGTGNSPAISVDGQVLRRLDMAFPRTFDEMMTILRAAKDVGLPHKMTTSLTLPPYFLHRTYVEWPFFVDRDSLMIYYADGTMEPYIASDVFDKDNAHLRQMEEEGLLYLMGENTYSTIAAATDVAMGMGGSTLGMAADVVTELGMLEPERPTPREIPLVTGALFLAAQCRNPELAMELIDTIYTNDEIFLTLIYGLEGEDWEYRPDGSVQVGSFLGVRTRFAHYTLSDRYGSQEELINREKWATQDYPFSAFAYRNDPYKISADLRACLEGIYDLRDGTLPADGKEEVIQRMNENGFRELLEEWEARYEAYKAQQ